MAYGYVDNEIETWFPGAPVDKTGNEVAQIPDMDFSGSIRYDLSLGKLGVASPQFECSYIGPAEIATTNTAGTHGDYWTFNARLNYRDNDSGLGVSIFVENISDLTIG